jgi:hypothetical protein
MTAGPALLYIGAGVDVRPVQRYSHIFKTFVYVDGLPSSKYFDWTKDTMITKMKLVLENEGCPVKTVPSPPAQTSAGADIIKAGNSQILYFFDTSDQDMWNNKFLAELLNKHVTTLYLAGFFPTIIKALPHLKQVIYAENCSPYHKRNQGKWAFDHKLLKHTVVRDYDSLGEDGSNKFFVDCDHCGGTNIIDGV